MSTLLFIIVGIPLIEIFIMIKIGGIIGAFNTLLFILFTAVTGVYFAKLEGLNELKSAITKTLRNEVPFYELVSGAALMFAALLLIIPGFVTDIVGFLLIIPFTRKFLIKLITKKQKKNINFIDGEYEEINDDK